MKRIAGFVVFVASVVSGISVVTPQVHAQPRSESPTSQQDSVGDQQGRAKAHAELGTLYYQSGNMSIALQEAQIAIEADGNYAPAYNLMGLIRMYLQEKPLAQENFERASRLAPGDAEIANNYGWFLCQNGREREAIKLFQMAASNPLYKTPTKPYTNAGLCTLRLKDDKGADDFFQLAARADESNTQALFHIADIAFRRSDYFNAKKFIDEVLRISEPNAEALWLALRVERKIGDRSAEASYASQLRRKFAGTPQHQALLQGKFE